MDMHFDLTLLHIILIFVHRSNIRGGAYVDRG